MYPNSMIHPEQIGDRLHVGSKLLWEGERGGLDISTCTRTCACRQLLIQYMERLLVNGKLFSQTRSICQLCLLREEGVFQRPAR